MKSVFINNSVYKYSAKLKSNVIFFIEDFEGTITVCYSSIKMFFFFVDTIYPFDRFDKLYEFFVNIDDTESNIFNDVFSRNFTNFNVYLIWDDLNVINFYEERFFNNYLKNLYFFFQKKKKYKFFK